MENNRLIRNLSVKNKITAIILFVSFLVMIAGFAFISYWDVKRLKDEISSQLTLHARIVGDYCVIPLVFEDSNQAIDALSRLKLVDVVEEGYLLDSTGKVFATFPGKIQLNDELFAKSLEGVTYQRNHFYVTSFILFEGRKIGTLIFRANSSSLQRENIKLIYILSGAFVFMVLVSVLLAFRLQKILTGPILRLASLTKDVSTNLDYSVNLEYQGNDEIKLLYTQFGNLLKSLSAREIERDTAENKLKSLNDLLNKELSERKAIEASLRESEERYRYLFEANPAPMVIYDQATMKLLSVNDAFINHYGYPREEALCIPLPEYYPEEERASIIELIKNLKGYAISGEWHHIKKDGTKIGVLTTSHSVSFMGHMARIVVITDITERQKAEAEIRFLAQVIRNINECVSITDVNNKVTYVNQSWLRTFGYSEEEIIGKSIGLIVASSNRPGITDEILTSTLDGGWQGEIINRKKDGTEFPVMLFTTIIHDKENKPFALVGISSDISEHRKNEIELEKYRNHLEDLVKERTEELAKAREDAEKANMAKSEFLANMSHEIRTPMNAVLGYTDLLSSLLTDPIQREYIESIKSSGRSLLTLINDILDLSKIEAGRLDLEYDFIDARAFFIEFERIFSLKAKEKGIKFLVEVSSGIPNGIYVDEPRLRQIVFNLIGNAIKFTNKGHVKLRIYTDNLHIVQYTPEKSEEFIDLIIDVEDTGIGISKELREEIFDPFVQARDQKNIGGTGLGLAITRRLTILMNGTISLKSELGEGSTFSVKIPDVAFKREFTTIDPGIKINPANILFKESKILVVDDVQHNRTFIKDSLRNTPISVYQAEDGFIALEMANKYSPDLIISDIRMPNMDGFELLKRLKSDEKLKKIPVIAYSASVLKNQKEIIHKSEFVGLLTKPLNIAELYIELINYLPYVEQKSTKVEGKKTKKDVQSISGKDDLIKELETVQLQKWKNFEIRQPINEIISFGNDLVTTAKEHNAKTIEDYGNELINAADSFNIEAILSLLKNFRSIIDDLK